MEQLSFPSYDFKIRNSGGTESQILDEIRQKYVKLTPEEWVRQHTIRFLEEKGYPKSLMKVEKEISLFSTKKRFDVLVHGGDGKPFLLVECKAPGVKISQDTFDQICRYNAELNVPLLLVTNGIDLFCVTYSTENGFRFLDHIPVAGDLSFAEIS